MEALLLHANGQRSALESSECWSRLSVPQRNLFGEDELVKGKPCTAELELLKGTTKLLLRTSPSLGTESVLAPVSAANSFFFVFVSSLFLLFCSCW